MATVSNSGNKPVVIDVNQDASTIRPNQIAPHAAIEQQFGHVFTLLNSLKTRLEETVDITTAYSAAESRLNNLKNDLDKSAASHLINIASPDKKVQAKAEKAIGKEMKKAEGEAAKIISKFNNSTLLNRAIDIHLAEGNKTSEERQEFLKLAQQLAKGGASAAWIKMTTFLFKSHAVAYQHFQAAKGHLENQTSVKQSKDSTQTETSKINQEYASIVNDPTHASSLKEINKRTGVIGINGTYQVAIAFDKKKIAKQLKSIKAQTISLSERSTIEKDLHFHTNGTNQTAMNTKLIPLNGSFDKAMYASMNGKDSAELDVKDVNQVFTKIVGEKGGISSANRHEPHLINGWSTELKNSEGVTSFKAIRHAILSDKYEKDLNVRSNNSKQAATELLQAAVMQELAERGLSLQQASHLDQPLNLILNSVSLVTPDSIRDLSLLNGIASEKNMLKDQLEALKHLTFLDSIRIDGSTIPLNVDVAAFNFGVNAGAVGSLGFGVHNQYGNNLKALQNLKNQIDRDVPQTHPRSKQINDLFTDIKKMMENPNAYLDGNNQYEIGAKIMNLTNEMNRVKKGDISTGAKCAFNCMSGKDRTGIMDAVAKTYATMAEMNGSYPSHEALNIKGSTEQEQFKTIFKGFLIEGGGLEITELNTGVKGYKVTDHALVGGLEKSDLADLIGLSSATSS